MKYLILLSVLILVGCGECDVPSSSGVENATYLGSSEIEVVAGDVQDDVYLNEAEKQPIEYQIQSQHEIEKAYEDAIAEQNNEAKL